MVFHREHRGAVIRLQSQRDLLAAVKDLERLIARLSAGSGNPRDVKALGTSLEQIAPLAEALAQSGHSVELVTGPTACQTHHPNIHRTDVENAREMYEACLSAFPSCQAAFLSAAVADYRPEQTADHKIKKQGNEGLTLRLVQNPDILATLGSLKRPDQTLVGFALETDNELDNARRKLVKKNLDFIVLNSLRDPGAGFGVDTNKVTIIARDGSSKESPLMSKKEVARLIVETVTP